MTNNACSSCGAELGAPTRETRPYHSLPDTWLVGVEVYRCPSCGEEETVIPRIEELGRVLTWAVASRPGRLTGDEIRFLRKHLGWSGADFARSFSVDPATVSRWEAGKQQMDLRAEQLLRTAATRLEPVKDHGEFVVFLQKATQERPADLRLQLRWSGQGWEHSPRGRAPRAGADGRVLTDPRRPARARQESDGAVSEEAQRRRGSAEGMVCGQHTVSLDRTARQPGNPTSPRRGAHPANP